MVSPIRTPYGMPLPLAKKYTGSSEETRSKFETEIGFARVRNVHRISPQLFSLEWDLTAAEYQNFDIWWQYTIYGGAKEFDIQLIDGNQIVWYTAKFVTDYTAELLSDYSWNIKAAVRILGDYFLDRPSGTDELHGYSEIAVFASGNLSVEKVFRGEASVGVNAEAIIETILMGALAYVEVQSTGSLFARPFWGSAQIEVGGLGQLSALGDPEVILQFDDVTLNPDLGSNVILQFDNVPYIPPQVAF